MIVVETEAERTAIMQSLITGGCWRFVCFRYGQAYGLLVCEYGFPVI